MTIEQVSAKVRAGTQGWLAGLTLGAPFDRKPDWRNIAFYTPIPDGVVDTLPFLAAKVYLGRAKDQYGLCDLYPELPLLEDAQRFALANIERGLRAPLSGTFENPFGEDGSAMGRAPFWGLLFAGRPDVAAAWAWHDATIEHFGEGVWAACFWSAAVAASPFVTSVSECLQIAEGVLPADSELRKVSPAMIQAWQAGKSWQEAREIALRWAGCKLPHQAVATHAFALIGCLYGGGDFGRTICFAAGCGGHSVSSAGCAGAVLSAGTGTVPPDWVLDSGGLEEKLAGRFEGLGRPFFEGLRATAAVEDNGAEPVAEPALDLSFLRATTEITRLHKQPMNLSLQAAGELVAGFRYPDGVVSDWDKPLAIGFRIENPNETAIEVSPEIRGSDGVSVASKAARIRLEAMGVANIAAIAIGDHGYAIMRVNEHEVRAPILRPQIWWIVGPFDNRGQEGYDKAYAPEREMNPDAVMSGRSALPMRWERRAFDGCVFEIEPLFINAPGVIYLATEARFGLNEAMKMVVASPVGQAVWIDGEKRNWYQDTHQPVPRPHEPYAVEFQPKEWTRFLVKLTRNQQPVEPATIYFVREDGRLVFPEDFRQPRDQR